MTSSHPHTQLALIQRTSVARATLVVCAALSMLGARTASAATTDIASQPLATTSAVHAKPNLLFILDDSGSMGSAYMPDEMYDTTTYGYKSPQCNGVAYDPSVVYQLPLKADGVTTYPNASFSAAKSDGFNSSSSTANLAGSVYYLYTGSQPRMGWRYTTSGVIVNTFYKECFSVVGATPGSSVFTAVTVSSTSSEAQNYANWYAYYRKRYLMMRSAMGRAIAKLDSNYRVGFSTISDTTAVDGTNYFRDVKDFDSTQKTNFYSSLYTAAPNSWTPLRGALSKAGRYYANKASGQTYDPMQYSCQRNYALLSTDGYWNANTETTTYGPFQLNSNTNVGNQDASETRPMRDASLLTTKVVTSYTAPATSDHKSTSQTQSRTWSRTASTITAGTKKTCTGQNILTVTPQTATETQSRYFTTPQTGTYGYTVTVTTVEGSAPSSPVESTHTLQGAWADQTGATTSTVIVPGSTSSWSNGSATVSCTTSPTSSTTNYTTPTVGSWGSWSGTLTYSNVNIVIGTYTAGTPSTSSSYAGGSTDSLADVAEYYWKTDLRNSTWGNCTSTTSGISRDVCNDNVRPVGNDASTNQHMNTFTIGLGVNGLLTYDKNYPTQTSGDFVDLTNGVKNWSNPFDGGEAVNIDDLWHAAVNGRGRYYTALNATDLSEAISGVVSEIESIPGAAAAAATSTLELVSGENNLLFSASYTTQQWTGDLKAYAIDGKANISATASWSAQTLLDAKTYSDRNIYFKGASGALTLFTYANLNATQKGYFDNLCTQSVVAAQCTTLSTADKTLANSGTYLVNYLRGDRTFETVTTVGTSTTGGALYRKREHVLGDVINGAPVYVGKPPFSYADAGYSDFRTANLSRQPMVYVAANDGMLHAFSGGLSGGGAEVWAFVPSAIMSKMYLLADSSYASKHQYYVDGAPSMGDVKIGSTWKTIVVGGFNKGGSGYYALDITDPANPALLWEFSDTNMGLSYGNPIITKRQDGTWVVVVTSGLNNTSGDGKGHLFVIDAATGTKLQDIATSEGSTTTPAGLNKINAWIDNTNDNTSLRFYGGDMLGNVWRFDPDARYAAVPSALQLAKLQIDSLTPQPITTKPMTAIVSDSPVVLVGTGRYLGESDITDATQQSLYAIRDPLGSTGWGDVRSDTTDFTKQVLTLNNIDPTKATGATITAYKVDWTKGGWWVDFPSPRERLAVNMGLQLGTLAIGTAVPSGDACASGGSSWRYYLSVGTGSSIAGTDAGVRWNDSKLIVGISWVKDADGNVRTIYQDSDGQLRTEVPPTSPGGGSGLAHRTSWRELVD